MRYTFPVVLNLKEPPHDFEAARQLAGCVETAIYNELEGEIELGEDGGIWCGIPQLGVVISTAEYGPQTLPETDPSVIAERDRRIQELQE